MKITFVSYLLTLLPVLIAFATANHPAHDNTKSRLDPENERVTFISYRRDRTAILRIERRDQQSMIARVPLTQSRASETEIAGEVNWGRRWSGVLAHIVDKPDGMECVLEHRRTGVLVECWDEEVNETDKLFDKDEGESLLSEGNRISE